MRLSPPVRGRALRGRDHGPFDLVVVPGWISNVDFAWEDPLYGDWVRRLAAFSRVIVFDKRGTGLSDRDVGDSTGAFGANLLGAMVGGLIEYVALVTGYQALLVVVALLYGAAWLIGTRGGQTATA